MGGYLSFPVGALSPLLFRLFMPLLLLSLLLLLLLPSPQYATAQVDVHTARLIVTSPGWPTTQEGLTRLTEAVTSVVCKPLRNIRSSTTACKGFLLFLSEDRFSVEMVAENTTIADSAAISHAFQGWVDGNYMMLLTDLTAAASDVTSGSLPVPVKEKGLYTLSCRNPSTDVILSTCSSPEACRTSIIVHDMSENVNNLLCSYVPNPCSRYVVTSALSDTQRMVNITGLVNTLEIVLQFTDEVRRSSTDRIRIDLYSHGRTAQLYAFNESETYDQPIRTVPLCDSSSSMWLISLIFLFFAVLIFLRYVWYRGRHNTKKKERRIIIEDERRIQFQAAHQGVGEVQVDKEQCVKAENKYAKGCAPGQQQQLQGQHHYDGYGQSGYPREYNSVQEEQLREYVGYTTSVYPQEYVGGAAAAAAAMVYDENAVGEHANEDVNDYVFGDGDGNVEGRAAS